MLKIESKSDNRGEQKLNINRDTKSMTEAAILTALFCVFSLVGLYIPVLTFLLAVMPALLIVLGVRRGVKYTVMTLIVATFILVTVSNPIIALLSVTLPSLSAVIITYLMRKGKSHLTVILAGAMSFAVTTAITIYANLKLMGINIVNVMNVSFEEAIVQQSKFIESLDIPQEAYLETVDRLRQGMELLKDAVPIMIISSAFLLMILNYTVAIKILKRTGTKVNDLPKFRYYKLPKEAMTGLLVIYLLTFIVSKANLVNQEVLMLNVFMLVQYVFIIQGVAVAIYYMHQFKMHTVVKVITMIIILFSGIGAMILFYVGIVDIFVDIRKFKPEISDS